MKTTLVTGGVRSGKSRFALELAKTHGKTTFVATLQPADEEMEERVKRHQADRPQDWPVIEAPVNLKKGIQDAAAQADTVLVDCLGVWTSNRLLALGDDRAPGWIDRVAELETALTNEIADAISIAREAKTTLIMVTNEVGFGVVPAYPLGRAFRDLLGRVNQTAAAHADRVVLTVCGLTIELKNNQETR